MELTLNNEELLVGIFLAFFVLLTVFCGAVVLKEILRCRDANNISKIRCELREEDPSKNEDYLEAIKELNLIREVRELKVREEMVKTLRELHLKQDKGE